ncbi:hypothetical protein [Mobilicoccus sp.]|uniref:hypothetical protein n=1 Tax=Mobilicoccus sp. TaxID=2034349 RepID=UPI0028AFEB93|nr:hypothetical protein [Mobilicoccus sp.]
MTATQMRRWRVREPALLVVVFALTSWFPVAYVLDRQRPEVGSRAWPVTSFPTALLTAVVAVVLLDRVVVRRRPPVWACAAAVVTSWCLAAWVYLQWVPRYRPVSDRATALEIGWRAIASGQDPYTFHTQLGNPIAPLPGGIILAGPTMTVFGDLHWYGLIWAAVVLAVCWWGAGPAAATVVAVLGVVSPMIRLELYSQSDAWINAAALVVFGSAGWMALGRAAGGDAPRAPVFLARLRPRPGRARGTGVRHTIRRRGVAVTSRPSTTTLTAGAWTVAAVLAGVLFGLALAYRVILAPVALPLAIAMWRQVGWRPAAAFVIPAATVALVATLTPLLLNPSALGPWTMAAHHATSPRTPHLGAIIAASMLLVTVAGARRARSLAAVWATAAASLATMIAVVWWGQATGRPSYETVAYDGALLVFTLAAFVGPRATRRGIPGPWRRAGRHPARRALLLTRRSTWD